VFQPKQQARPPRIDADLKALGEPMPLVRDPNPPAKACVPEQLANAQTLAGAQWVWFPEMESGVLAPPATRYFRKAVTIPADRKIKKAHWLLAADNYCVPFVNGRDMGRVNGWDPPADVDLTHCLQPGANILAVAAKNGGTASNPAGLIGRIWIEFEQGEPLVETIDKTWKAAKDEQKDWNALAREDSGWLAAKEIAAMGDAPWGSLSVGKATLSPVVAADPFRSRFTLPKSMDLANARVCLEMDALPDDAASVTVNGVYAGGVIGKPSRLDITRCVKKDGENTIVIEPLSPKSARLVFYSGMK
jgi:alpha-L-rhamnosidase